MTERLPAPDARRFPSLRPDHLRSIPAGHQFGRIYAVGGSHPTTWSRMRSWGPTSNRFDHQPPPPRRHATRRVLYAAPNSSGITRGSHSVLRTCLAEVFRDRGVIELSRDAPYFVLFDTVGDLELIDVADGPWITESGGNAAISSGLRSTARDWARAIYRTYRGIHGILYTCANIPATRSVVLWERAERALPVRPALNRPLADPVLRADIERDARFLQLDLAP